MKVNENNVRRLKTLLDAGMVLPYKEMTNKFIDVTIDPKLPKDSFANKSIADGLIAFGEYLEEKKVLMPLKIDVIDFVLLNHGLDERTLQWYFGVCMEFVIFCQSNYNELFDGILLNTGVTRKVKFYQDSLIQDDQIIFLKGASN